MYKTLHKKIRAWFTDYFLDTYLSQSGLLLQITPVNSYVPLTVSANFIKAFGCEHKSHPVIIKITGTVTESDWGHLVNSEENSGRLEIMGLRKVPTS